MAAEGAARLPTLQLAEWEATKTTLHLWLQIVGKVRMASASLCRSTPPPSAR